MDRTFWITKPLVVLFDTFIYSESLRFLSLHDNKYLRYYKGHQLTMTGLLHVQGRPATTYDDQGPVFAVAFGGYIRMFDAHSDAVKFSNDGRLMLPTSMEGHIRVLDSFQGTLVLMMVVDMLGAYGAGKGVVSWMSFHTEPPVIKWAPGSLMFVTGSSELSFWNPNVSILGAYVGRK
ncbi:protein ANTHESIS POMOTING FACTOR 1-like isoform X2 [Citrus sinensis]|uniref:protein ANTHESIS POMOTING FACTOR 1-like isoform X2 n=1 Tax=Citrus clementina TaxID=85681 RepID=UPI000CED5ABC|nr:protein ANTHESIS POMOTING FACTOR 1-like isoform X2 [Citrus x clementina]XP_052297838.1 protein ANTHESIS POMOTING FACTOR 1-like isoform X2 [Citrus sinensis]